MCDLSAGFAILLDMILLSLRPLFLFALLAVLAAACGSGDGTAGTDAGISPSADAAKADAAEEPETCNFQNCTGCCDGNTCVEVVTNDKCGQPGAACQACTGDDTCVAGSCVPAQGCDNCEGCCFEGTVCLEGNTKAACGSDGDSCATCPSTQGCNSGGVCEEIICDETNCANGCCTANGECITDAQQTTDACGKDSNACGVCEGGALSCTLGTCVMDQPCLDFCDDGCCTPDGQCIVFADQDADTCGAAETCFGCSDDLSCLEGSCTADPVWTVVVRSAVIAETDPDGGEWDQSIFTNALPDPFVMGALADDTFLDWITPTIDDTLTPNWNEPEGSYLQSDLVSQGLAISIRDSDGLGVFESIGNCYVSITQDNLNSGTKIQASCGSASNLELGFVQQ